MNVNYAKFQKKFDSRITLNSSPCRRDKSSPRDFVAQAQNDDLGQV